MIQSIVLTLADVQALRPRPGMVWAKRFGDDRYGRFIVFHGRVFQATTLFPEANAVRYVRVR